MASRLCHNLSMRVCSAALLSPKTEGPFSFSFFLSETVGHSARSGRAVNISLATVVPLQQRRLSARDTRVPAASAQGLCVNVGSPGHRDLRLHIKVTSMSGHRPAWVFPSERNSRTLLYAFLRATSNVGLSLHALHNRTRGIAKDLKARTPLGANPAPFSMGTGCHVENHIRRKALLLCCREAQDPACQAIPSAACPPVTFPHRRLQQVDP